MPLSPDLSYATAGVAHVLALSGRRREAEAMVAELEARARDRYVTPVALCIAHLGLRNVDQVFHWLDRADEDRRDVRSEEHTTQLQSPDHLVCRLLLVKKKRHIYGSSKVNRTSYLLY